MYISIYRRRYLLFSTIYKLYENKYICSQFIHVENYEAQIISLLGK